jgi:hypothetical protein
MDDTDEEFDEDAYDKLLTNINMQFIEAPFNITCINDLSELDIPFTDYDGIIIKDDRASEYNYYYSDLTENERNQYINYLGISKIDNKPMTLRQILNKMILTTHYNNDIVKSDDHSFLVGFEKKGITYTANFES